MTGTLQSDPALVTTSTTLAPPRPNVPRSAAAFLVIIAILVVIKLVIAQVANAGFASPAQAAVFGWTFIASFMALGLLGVWAAAYTGFPETWDPAVPIRDRFWLPAVAGLVLGALAIVVDSITGWTAIEAAKHHMGTIHIPWPMSLVIYPGGAAISNIIFYLVPIPLVMLIVKLFTSGRWSTETFWVVGTLAAAVEPLLQDTGMMDHPGIMAATFAQDFAFNFAQVYAFRRAGFGSSVVLRTSYYLIWHVLWGAVRG